MDIKKYVYIYYGEINSGRELKKKKKCSECVASTYWVKIQV